MPKVQNRYTFHENICKNGPPGVLEFRGKLAINKFQDKKETKANFKGT